MISPGKDRYAPRRRIDFEQNRDRILAAADAVFTELGTAAPVAAVAGRAGVAPATVYRHFPARADLVEAVLALRIDAYCSAIEEAQKLDDPRAAFRSTLRAIVELQSRDRSFREIMAARGPEPWLDPDVARFGVAFLGALRAAREAGVIRDGVADTDIMVLLIATEGVARPTAERSPATLRRLVDVLVDGVTGERSDLAGEALEFDEVLDVSRG